MKRINHIRNRDKVKRRVTSKRYLERHSVDSYLQYKGKDIRKGIAFGRE